MAAAEPEVAGKRGTEDERARRAGSADDWEAVEDDVADTRNRRDGNLLAKEHAIILCDFACGTIKWSRLFKMT